MNRERRDRAPVGHREESGEGLWLEGTDRRSRLLSEAESAEFKFINWPGGPESTRQNVFYGDFFDAAEHVGGEEKYL